MSEEQDDGFLLYQAIQKEFAHQADPRAPAPTQQERLLIVKAAHGAWELERTFDTRWAADQRGVKRWQRRTGRNLTWPDHADLVVWLLDERDKEKRRSWWEGAIVGALTILGIFIGWLAK